MGKKKRSKPVPAAEESQGCISPHKCLVGSPVDEKNPSDAVLMFCTSGSRCTVRNHYIHQKCYTLLEEFLTAETGHQSHTGRRKLAFESKGHRRGWLWNKAGWAQTYRLRRCRCPGGVLTPNPLEETEPRTELAERAASPEPCPTRKGRHRHRPLVPEEPLASAPVHPEPTAAPTPNPEPADIPQEPRRDLYERRPSSERPAHGGPSRHRPSAVVPPSAPRRPPPTAAPPPPTPRPKNISEEPRMAMPSEETAVHVYRVPVNAFYLEPRNAPLVRWMLGQYLDAKRLPVGLHNFTFELYRA